LARSKTVFSRRATSCVVGRPAISSFPRFPRSPRMKYRVLEHGRGFAHGQVVEEEETHVAAVGRAQEPAVSSSARRDRSPNHLGMQRRSPSRLAMCSTDFAVLELARTRDSFGVDPDSAPSNNPGRGTPSRVGMMASLLRNSSPTASRIRAVGGAPKTQAQMDVAATPPWGTPRSSPGCSPPPSGPIGLVEPRAKVAGGATKQSAEWGRPCGSVDHAFCMGFALPRGGTALPPADSRAIQRSRRPWRGSHGRAAPLASSRRNGQGPRPQAGAGHSPNDGANRPAGQASARVARAFRSDSDAAAS